MEHDTMKICGYAYIYIYLYIFMAYMAYSQKYIFYIYYTMVVDIDKQ